MTGLGERIRGGESNRATMQSRIASQTFLYGIGIVAKNGARDGTRTRGLRRDRAAL